VSLATLAPLDLERAGWRALTTSADAARDLYDEVLADDVVMLLPGGLRVEGRADALDAMSGPSWNEHRMADERVVDLTDDCVLVAYRADARRGDTSYTALVGSVDVRGGGGWRLALHQQTPC
jgi:hypothetical protein